MNLDAAKHTQGGLLVAPVTDKRHHFVALMAPDGTDRSGEKNVQVAMCSINHVPWEVAQANAKRLALCWNMHDRLVEHLRNMVSFHKGPTSTWEYVKNAISFLAEIDGAS